MAILTVGTDLAKNEFALNGVSADGQPELLQPRIETPRVLPTCSKAVCRRAVDCPPHHIVTALRVG